MPYDFKALANNAQKDLRKINPHGSCLVLGQGRGDKGEKIVAAMGVTAGLAALNAFAKDWEKSQSSQPHRSRKAVFVSPSEVHMLFSDGKRAATARLEILPSPNEPWDNRRKPEAQAA